MIDGDWFSLEIPGRMRFFAVERHLLDQYSLFHAERREILNFPGHILYAFEFIEFITRKKFSMQYLML